MPAPHPGPDPRNPGRTAVIMIIAAVALTVLIAGALIAYALGGGHG